MGVKFVDITFSIMKSNKLVIGALLDSMIMNLGEGASVSLSEVSGSFKLRLNFLFGKEAISVIYFPWSYAPPPTRESNFRKEWTTLFALGETGIHYQYTRILSKISNFSQILDFITQSNRVKKPFPLNTIGP